MKKTVVIVSILVIIGIFAAIFSLNRISPEVIQANTFIGDINLSGKTLKNAGVLLQEKRAGLKIALITQAGKVSMPYEKLGVKILTAEALSDVETSPRFGLASLLSFGNSEKKHLRAAVSVDSNLLTHIVLQAFPFLSSPEEAYASFFITSPDQKVKQTFNVRRLVSQLTQAAEELRETDIELDVVPPDEEIPQAISEEELRAQKEELKGKTLVLNVSGQDVQKLRVQIPLAEGDWFLETSSGVVVNEEKLRNFLAENVARRIERPVQNAVITQFVDEGRAARVEVSGIARDGIRVPFEESIRLIQESVARGNFDVQLVLQRDAAQIVNQTGLALGNMELLGVGRSNYAGSPEGRAFNIRKGLRERMNNIIVPPGADFSFNSLLGSLRASDGWKLALGIFGGGSLKPTLGGGLCQVSTTVYRAALEAGLKIKVRRSHSLYVKYYKEYGEGLDSTVFVGGQDLIFTNDTPSYIFIQSYDDGDDGYVKIHGTSDGRVNFLDGPYRFHNTPAEKAYKPKKNEIAWFRTIQWSDGRKENETIVSRYRTVPHH